VGIDALFFAIIMVGERRSGGLVSENNRDHDDSDVFGVVALMAKILGHVIRMAGRHGIEIDDENVDAAVKAILEKEDC